MMDTRTKGIIDALTAQRNDALDRCALLNGTVAVLHEEIEALKAQLAAKEPPQPA